MIESRSVSWLVQYLKALIEGDLSLSNLWIEGEISNVSRSARGHAYFTLKDEASQLRCVMFQRAYRGMPMENGAFVLAHGSVSFYEQRGDIQVIVDFVQPAGVGARQAEFERLKERLTEEGLFEEARKRPLPAFPLRIGVVTSPTGAVFHDICNVLARRWPLAEIVLSPTPVQGNEAAIGITEAIRNLGLITGIDVIIVARGGGSIEELWPFNEEMVAKAIFGSPVPVVSADGHETDFTIADFVADVRAPTPSAAAETVSPDWREVSRRIEGLTLATLVNARGLITDAATKVDRAGHRLRSALPDVSRYSERVSSLLRHAVSAATRAAESREERVGGLTLRLGALDPHATLARGYAVVQRRDSKDAVTSVNQVKGKDRLDVFVHNGRFPAEVSRQYGF